MMQNSFGAAALVALAALGSAGAQQKIDVGRRARPDVTIRLTGSYAKLKITGWNFDSISVVGVLPKDSKLSSFMGDDAATPTGGAKMYIEQADDHAPPGGTLELRVPRNARVITKAGSADVEASGVTGELDINVLGGSVRVSGRPRLLNVETIDASMYFDGVADWVRLKTAEGDITMNGRSPDAAFTTISGNVRVGGGTFEHARFGTVTGGVTFTGDLAPGASLYFDTHSGSVDIQFGPTTGAEVSAITANGTIENLVPYGKPAVIGRENRGQEIGFMVGKGRGRVVVNSFKGNIKFSMR